MTSLAVYFVFTLLTCFSTYYIIMYDVNPITRKIVISILLMDVTLFYVLFATLVTCELLKREGQQSAILCHLAIAKYGRKSDMGLQVLFKKHMLYELYTCIVFCIVFLFCSF